MLATNKKKKILNTAQAYAGLRTRSLELVGLWTHDHGMIERQTDRHTHTYTHHVWPLKSKELKIKFPKDRKPLGTQDPSSSSGHSLNPPSLSSKHLSCWTRAEQSWGSAFNFKFHLSHKLSW